MVHFTGFPTEGRRGSQDELHHYESSCKRGAGQQQMLQAMGHVSMPNEDRTAGVRRITPCLELLMGLRFPSHCKQQNMGDVHGLRYSCGLAAPNDYHCETHSC